MFTTQSYEIMGYMYDHGTNLSKTEETSYKPGLHLHLASAVNTFIG